VKVRKRMLIAHEDGPTRLALMRSFESRDWAVQGVRTDEGVVEMLDADKDFSTLLLSWEMPKHAAVRALTSLGQLAAEDRPVILAFGHKWPLVELQRALQFGADGVLVEPLKPEVVEAELAARVRPGALLLLSGFRSVDLQTVRAAFEGHFEMPAVPTARRDDGWLMLACRRRAGSPIDGRALSDAAVEG
jgi:DNA-binding response OmpR family regulator